MNNHCMNQLKNIREKKGVSYEDMARKLNISKAYYWQIEHKNRRLSYEMAKNIASIFGLKPDDLFYNEYKSLTTK